MTTQIRKNIKRAINILSQMPGVDPGALNYLQQRHDEILDAFDQVPRRESMNRTKQQLLKENSRLQFLVGYLANALERLDPQKGRDIYLKAEQAAAEYVSDN